MHKMIFLFPHFHECAPADRAQCSLMHILYCAYTYGIWLFSIPDIRGKKSPPGTEKKKSSKMKLTFFN